MANDLNKLISFGLLGFLASWGPVVAQKPTLLSGDEIKVRKIPDPRKPIQKPVATVDKDELCEIGIHQYRPTQMINNMPIKPYKHDDAGAGIYSEPVKAVSYAKTTHFETCFERAKLYFSSYVSVKSDARLYWVYVGYTVDDTLFYTKFDAAIGSLSSKDVTNKDVRIRNEGFNELAEGNYYQMKHIPKGHAVCIIVSRVTGTFANIEARWTNPTLSIEESVDGCKATALKIAYQKSDEIWTKAKKVYTNNPEIRDELLNSLKISAAYVNHPAEIGQWPRLSIDYKTVEADMSKQDNK